MTVRRLIIIGSGSAGLTAAIYAARANLSPLLFEGPLIGGQLSLTTLVENYPGFPDGIMGPELMELTKRQALRFGTEILSKFVTRCDFSRHPFRVWSDEELFEAETIIIATGASSRMLGLPAERQLLGHGLSTCATCDGYFFRGKEIVVVGGGDSAMEESTFLTKFASKVSVVHRRDKLRASKIMQERAFKNPKIEFIWDTVVEDIFDPAKEKVTAVKLKNVKTDAVTEKKCEGVFVAIGHEPSTKLFQGQIELDPKGYIVTQEKTATSVKGVFACGDCVDHIYKQAVTAAGMGCMAAMDAEKFLEANAPH
ncbi:MAG: thioredoxin-disulfide reductase [Candidatus Omnitrophica bacterium]|nr:thioredoxin-disulfide reductase [Candidatus Omnitrophota bacterium]